MLYLIAATVWCRLTCAEILLSCSGALGLLLAMALVQESAGEESGAMAPTTADNRFSMYAFTIAFREAMEGCVIVAVLLNVLHKAGQDHMKKWVWFGAITSTVAFLGVGAILIAIFSSFVGLLCFSFFSSLFSLPQLHHTDAHFLKAPSV